MNIGSWLVIMLWLIDVRSDSEDSVAGLCLGARTPHHHLSQAFAEVKICSNHNETLQRSNSCSHPSQQHLWTSGNIYKHTHIVILHHLLYEVHPIGQRDPNSPLGPIWSWKQNLWEQLQRSQDQNEDQGLTVDQRDHGHLQHGFQRSLQRNQLQTDGKVSLRLSDSQQTMERELKTHLLPKTPELTGWRRS